VKICIGKIIKPQGIKGEVKIQPFCDVDAVWFYLPKNTVWVGEKAYLVKTSVLRFGYAYITFDGINTRNQSELLRGEKIWMPKEEVEKLKGKNQYFVDDLIGMTVESDGGEYIGQVVNVENFGATDIFVISENGRIVRVPFLDTVFSVQDGKIVANRSEYDSTKVD